jgi:hypothetical protein
VARVIIEAAMATGQPVAAVAASPFALTLWTWGEVRRIRRAEAVERLGERTDLAGLVAVAFHEPSKLQQAEWRYLKEAGTLSTMLDETRARLTALAAQMDAAASRTVPAGQTTDTHAADAPEG